MRPFSKKITGARNNIYNTSVISHKVKLLKISFGHNIHYSRGLHLKFCTALQWHHNGHDGVSNHQPNDCLHPRRSKKTSRLRVAGLLRRIHRRQVNSLHKGPVTRKMFPFDDVSWIQAVWQPGSLQNVKRSYQKWGMNFRPFMFVCLFVCVYACV